MEKESTLFQQASRDSMAERFDEFTQKVRLVKLTAGLRGSGCVPKKQGQPMFKMGNCCLFLFQRLKGKIESGLDVIPLKLI